LAILKNVLGLDLGSHTLKAVEVEQGLRSLRVVRVHAEPREAEVPLADQVIRMLRVHSFQRENVVTAVRGNRVSVRRLSFPFTEKRRLTQAVPFELEDLVPFDIDEMVLDWELAHRETGRAEVLAALAPRAEVSHLIETLHEADCDARTIECEGLVIANLAGAYGWPGNRLVVDVGHEKTTLCALRDGTAVSARSLGTAGRAFTEAVAAERALSLEDAERDKHARGVAEPGIGAPFPRAGAVIDRLANEIVRFATSLEPLCPEGIGELTLIGGGSQLEHLDVWLSERTGLSCRRIGEPRQDASLELGEAGSAALAPALALAMRGSGRATTHLNLRQDEFARRADFSRVRRELGPTGILAAVVAGIALVSFSTGAVLESREASRVEQDVAGLYSSAFPGQEIPADPLSAMRQAVSNAEERAEYLGVYRGNMSALDVLTEISRRVPEELEVGFEELSIDKQTIRLRVYATTFEAADRLGSELSKYGPFDQARIGSIETDNRTGGKKFNVTISLANPEGGP
jgi:general secretion pathway protein L